VLYARLLTVPHATLSHGFQMCHRNLLAGFHCLTSFKRPGVVILNRSESIWVQSDLCFTRLLTVPARRLFFKFELIRNGYPHGDNVVTPFGRVEA
jgi:hypothetical protein